MESIESGFNMTLISLELLCFCLNTAYLRRDNSFHAANITILRLITCAHVRIRYGFSSELKLAEICCTTSGRANVSMCVNSRAIAKYKLVAHKSTNGFMSFARMINIR